MYTSGEQDENDSADDQPEQSDDAVSEVFMLDSLA